MAGLLIFVIVLGGIAFSILRAKKSKEAWATAAARLGFALSGHSTFRVGKISGERQGIQVVVDTMSRGGGDSRKLYTRYQCFYPAVGPSVRMTKQHAFSFFGNMFGNRTDLLIGDERFDDSVVIESIEAQAVNRFLSPSRKMAILNLFENYHYGEVTERSISVERPKLETSSEEIESQVTWLVQLALFMSAPTEVDLALEKQAHGDLAEAVADLHRINAATTPSKPPNAFTQLLEAEGHMAMGNGTAAAETLDAIEVQGNTEIDGLRRVAAHHPSPPMPPSQPAPRLSTDLPPLPPAEADSGFDLRQQAVIDDLFSSHRMGYEVEEHFLDNYVGETVQWTGDVQRVMTYRFDSDFEGEGIKANVLIGTLGNGQLVTNKINAVIQLDHHEDIDRDRNVTFTGTLARVDRYMRNIYISEASLL